MFLWRGFFSFIYSRMVYIRPKDSWKDKIEKYHFPFFHSYELKKFLKAWRYKEKLMKLEQEMY